MIRVFFSILSFVFLFLPEQVINLTCISFRGFLAKGRYKVRLDNLVIVNRYKLQRSFITVLNVNNKLWVIMDTI